MRCRASSFKWKYPLLSLRSSSSFLRLLPRLLVFSIYPFTFPSITYYLLWNEGVLFHFENLLSHCKYQHYTTENVRILGLHVILCFTYLCHSGYLAFRWIQSRSRQICRRIPRGATLLILSEFTWANTFVWFLDHLLCNDRRVMLLVAGTPEWFLL